MSRPITLMSVQFGDLSLDEICKLAKEMGYEGLELCTTSHVNCRKAVEDPSYIPMVKETLKKHGINCWALSAHIIGQSVCDLWDPRLDGFVPSHLAGKPDEIRKWAKEEMMYVAKAADLLGVKVVTFFTGSPIFKYFYSFPQTSEEMIDAGFKEIVDVWSPIMDEFDKYDVKLALEVHPGEIAFDYYTFKRLLKEFDYRKTIGCNFDPSHLLWQGVDPVVFLHDFIDRVYHVHAKDVKLNFNGRTGVLGSHITFGSTERAWNFVSLGHGDVDFDAICRELNQGGYEGPISIEWEDSGMDRVYGATEACEYIKKYNFNPSNVAFDSAIKNDD